MNKATFVSEIPSKIEGNEVPTLNLVKRMLREDGNVQFNFINLGRSISTLDITEDQTIYILLGKETFGKSIKYLTILVQYFKDSIYTNLYKIDIEIKSDNIFGITVNNISNTGDETKDSQYGSIKFELCRLQKQDILYVALKLVKTNMDKSDLYFHINGLISDEVDYADYGNISVANGSNEFTEQAYSNYFTTCVYSIFNKSCIQPEI